MGIGWGRVGDVKESILRDEDEGEEPGEYVGP